VWNAVMRSSALAVGCSARSWEKRALESVSTWQRADDDERE
jgi:hypothetical protein